MNVADVLRGAHDEIAATGLSCGADVYTKDGGVLGGSCVFNDSEVATGKFNSHTLEETMQEVLEVATEQIDSMCVQGALWRAAHGDMQLFHQARQETLDVLIERGLTQQSKAHYLWLANDALRDRVPNPESEMLDALLAASKNADEKGL